MRQPRWPASYWRRVLVSFVGMEAMIGAILLIIWLFGDRDGYAMSNTVLNALITAPILALIMGGTARPGRPMFWDPQSKTSIRP